MRTHADSVRISHLCPEAQMQVSERAPVCSAKGNGEWKYSGEGIWPLVLANIYMFFKDWGTLNHLPCASDKLPGVLG